MSILSGFDVVIELARGIIVDKIRQVSIGGNNLDPPTEITLGDKTVGADVIILNDIQVTLSVGSNGIEITIPFDETTIYYNGHPIRPLKGTLTISGTIDEVPASGTTSDIGLTVPGNGVSLTWDTGSYTQTTLSALSTGDRTNLEAGIKVIVWSTINNNPPRAQLNFNVDPTKDGLLGTLGLRFRSITVQNIDADTIGVFCVALLSTQATPSISRTEPGQAGTSGAVISLSPDAFQHLVFCPGVASSMVAAFDPKTETPDQYVALIESKMPPVCGTAEYVPIKGSLKLVKIQATLENGYILLTGTAVRGLAGDTYCFRADANFDTHILVSVANGKVSFVLNPDPPNFSTVIDVSWYCFLLYFAALLVVSPISAAITIALLVLAEVLTDILAPLLVTDPLNLNQTEQVGLANFTLHDIKVFPERLTLFGSVPILPPPDQAGRSVSLQITSEQPTNKIETGSGIFHFPGSKVCKAKDYTYTEYSDEDVIALSATAQLMGTDPQFTWKVEGIPISGSSGTLQVTAPASIPQPGDLPGHDSGHLGMQSATVDYQLTDSTTLVLSGHGAFNFSINVAIECQSLTGFVVSENLFVIFENATIEMGDNYYSDMAACALASKLMINRIRMTPQQLPRSGDPPNYGETIQILREAIIQNKPGSLEALMSGARVFGNRIYTDILQLELTQTRNTTRS
jgi:hypothetical protein